jgi:hypothetical protein
MSDVHFRIRATVYHPPREGFPFVTAIFFPSRVPMFVPFDTLAEAEGFILEIARGLAVSASMMGNDRTH